MFSKTLSRLSNDKRRLKEWWRKQSSVRQDRYAMIAPLIAVGLFLAVILSSFAYLRFEETEREREGLKRDLDYTEQQINQRLEEHKEQLHVIGRDITLGLTKKAEFLEQAETLIASSPEILTLSWVDGHRQVLSAYITASATSLGWTTKDEIPPHLGTRDAFNAAKSTLRSQFSSFYLNADRRGMIQLQSPIVANGQFLGVVVAELSLDGLLRFSAPSESSKKYALSFMDDKNQRIAGSPLARAKTDTTAAAWGSWLSGQGSLIQQSVPFGINEDAASSQSQLFLYAQGYRTSQTFTGTALMLLVSALSLTTIWMLLANWRHSRRRQKAQDALIAETNFRRAMENSMPTGMRALDLEGRITYVNTAFCQMTKWREDELVGTLPPYAYWPDSEHERLHQVLEQELLGNNNVAGTEMRVLRRDGTEFDARMYVSPLVDSRGQQTGWMASVTDITEPKRVRDELGAAYERFTAILEAMDASISVSSLGDKRLLFANKLYREWFGENTIAQPPFVKNMLAADSEVFNDDVDALAGLPLSEVEDSPSESTEIYVEQLERWLEVRVRYLNWVDGHLAQMVIANDITARRTAEISAAQQAERAQNASRLITMGEMASSVAHELNQPLAAIANYCYGMTSRLNSGIENGQINTDDLLGAIAKTNKQAQRAGQIIQRIRNFVKRSAPNRTPSDISSMVNDALELAGLEVKRRNVTLTHYVAARLPLLNVDPILIEQVLINLIRNAAQAIDEAERPSGLRRIELKVTPKTILQNDESLEAINFSVQDTGNGVPPDMLKRVFDAFFTTKSEGMGIGLNLCHSIVESHQGRLTAENIYNGKDATGGEIIGCRFSFWLPLTPSTTAKVLP